MAQKYHRTSKSRTLARSGARGGASTRGRALIEICDQLDEPAQENVMHAIWRDLPHDIHARIISHINEICTWCAARFVCKTWLREITKADFRKLQQFTQKNCFNRYVLPNNMEHGMHIICDKIFRIIIGMNIYSLNKRVATIYFNANGFSEDINLYISGAIAPDIARKVRTVDLLYGFVSIHFLA